MIRFLKHSLALAAAFALALAPVSVEKASAAATTQTLHQFLCAPVQTAGTQARRVVNTSSTASPQPSYVLNADGCAVIANADTGFFLSQGYYYGPNQFVIQQMAITANTTATTSTLVLPQYAYIIAIVVEETAGNAVTGGINVGDSGSAARFVSAFAVGANSTAVATLVAGTGQIFSNSGVPSSDQILIAAVTGFNSASLTVSVIYGYY